MNFAISKLIKHKMAHEMVSCVGRETVYFTSLWQTINVSFLDV